VKRNYLGGTQLGVSREQAKISCLFAFGKPTYRYCNTLQVIRTSEVFREDRKMDPIDVANGKSLDAFIEEYLPER
jgi:hypothetical protein